MIRVCSTNFSGKRYILTPLHRCLVAFELVLLLSITCLATEPASIDRPTKSTSQGAKSAEPINFAEEVWPILKSRCFHCHDAASAQGELRLDEHDSVLAGGHSGQTIIGTIDDSELLRRIKSEEDGYRMPKDEVPLTVEEVERIERWIEAGAPWEPPNELLNWAKERTTQAVLNEYLDILYEGYQKIGFLGVPSLLFLLGILVLERRKRSLKEVEESKAKKNNALDTIASCSRYSHYLVGVLAFLLIAVSVLLYHNKKDLEVARRERTNYRSNARGSNEPNRQGKKIPRPYRPKHPPQLGGFYYRGNDERNDRLFNGGFYRTATFHLSLVDTNGNELEWNDSVESGELRVQLRLQRAAFATQSLFRNSAIESSFLSRQIPDSNSAAFADTPANFKTVEPGKSWEANYTIATIEAGTEDKKLKGLIYVMPIPSQAHYGIQYDLQISDGKIGPASELWMGAILLTGSVVVLEPGKIPLAEWFDFQPIPEIVGGNTDDPDLLGITEHVEKTSYLNDTTQASDATKIDSAPEKNPELSP